MSHKARAKSRILRRSSRGETCNIRQRHNLATSGTGAAGAITLQGDHLADATALELAGNRLRGTVPHGLTVTLDGSDYTTVGRASAAAGAITVTVTPGLVGPLPGSTQATFGDNVSHPHRIYRLRTATERDARFAAAGLHRVHVEAIGDGVSIHRNLDDLVLTDGTTETVNRAERLERGTGNAGPWELTAGEAAG